MQTQWIALTGAPSSGKTSIINVLANRGYTTHPDITRQYIEEQRARGLTVEEIRRDGSMFRQITFERMRDSLLDLSPDQAVVHDGGLPDCIAYRRVFKVAVNDDVTDACRSFRFARVLLLEPLEQFEQDGIRVDEDQRLQQRIFVALKDTYRELGYAYDIVPAASLAQRVASVMEMLAI